MLNDVYEEQLIKRPTPLKMVFLKGLCWFLAVVLFLCGFAFKPMFIVGLAAFFGVYYLTQRFDVEFEYIYVNGELDIDKILGKAARKKVVTVDMSKLESLKPVKDASQQDDHFNGDTYDCTSRTGENQIFQLIVRNDNGAVRIYFEPKKEIVDAIIKIAPRKVFSLDKH